jgi:hypothetical protein
MQDAVTEPDTEILIEARLDEAEGLKLEASRDGVKDIERDARIEELESTGDMVADIPKDLIEKKGVFVQDAYGTRDRVVSSVGKPMQPGWYAKSESAQRRALERMMGTYRPHATDPIVLPTSRNGVRSPGTLKDYHESENVRHRNTEADAIFTANPATKPPPKPAPAPEPIMGYCWGCHKALPRYGIRADTRFCQDNGGKCSREFRNREANRAILDAAFKDDRAKTDHPAVGILDTKMKLFVQANPGFQIPYYYPPPTPVPPPPMSVTFAARNHRVGEFLTARKKSLLSR